ncbi:histidine--tRNA ligase [Carex littledalei]|uniref:Histidine--tRNA ligase, cytoplasmic n=1 Tax=Carex littledalei TaxID=544730 RepID=A0A833RHD3_9POAL|nr:histidine--tRNA ligase [Carex littledalei]
MAAPTVELGAKGFSPSSATIYSIANSLAHVEIDSSALDKLKPSSSSYSLPPSLAPSSNPNPRFLPPSFARAAIAVFLNKLLSSDSSVRRSLPVLLQQTLALSSGFDKVDFSSPAALLHSLCSISNTDINSISVSYEEIGFFETSSSVLIATAAILDCCATALIRVSDAVAALSCEAARADLAAFDLPVSGDGFSRKDETDVAADIKMLLFGSKLTGKNGSAVFLQIPSSFGLFREAVRLLHACTRIELNSSVKLRKPTENDNYGKEASVVDLVWFLAKPIKTMAETSFKRAKLNIGSITDERIRSEVESLFNQQCVGFDGFKESFDSVVVNYMKGNDSVAFLQGVYDLLVKFRLILAWEAAVALFSIEIDDSIEKNRGDALVNAQPNGENAKGDKKGEKKKKKKTLGKGTSAILQLLTDQVANGKEASGDKVAVLAEWARDLSAYFDPMDSRLEILVAKVKEIVETNEVRRLPKIAKGTRDFAGEQMAIREQAFAIIASVFKMHGAEALDTPVFELKETLMGKYGEDSKLIYDLADQGGELCSLRYDLTVPFARHLAMNNLSSMTRYQIAKVYRRDNPSKGRYREFYQCDFDIAGQYEPMLADFEVIVVLTQLLDRLDIGTYEIKFNHRKLLDGMLDICGVPAEKFRTVCSSIDKLDKLTFEQVKKELVDEKGLSSETADKIGAIVKKRGSPFEILSELKAEGSKFLENSGSVIALGELDILFRALKEANCLDNLVFDLSLARGLDYYTGVIYEAVFKGTTQVGSIAAGGRYDNLVGMFSGKQVPAVGVSLGIERVFAIKEQQAKDRNQVVRATETQVLVSILGKDVISAAKLVGPLWNANISSKMKVSKRVMDHITFAKQKGIPWMVLVGESEIASGVVKLKNIELNEEITVSREDYVEELRKRL